MKSQKVNNLKPHVKAVKLLHEVFCAIKEAISPQRNCFYFHSYCNPLIMTPKTFPCFSISEKSPL